MKDIPMFTTEYGAAGLILREIPCRKEAYVRVHWTADPKALLEECAAFCKALGAEKIFATGDSYLECYPLHTAVFTMRCSTDALGETDAALFPVQENTLARFLDIYNSKIMHVDNAASMSLHDGRKMLEEGDGYFVHKEKKLLGIGRAKGENILFLASIVPGAGKDILLALNHALSGDCAQLDVASTNQKAIALYESLGFYRICEKVRWFQIV